MVWASTYNGLNLVHPDGKVLQSIFVEQGLSTNEFNRFSTLKLPDGRLVFGSVKGLNIIKPSELKEDLLDEAQHRMFLTSVTYFNNQRDTSLDILSSHLEKDVIQIPAAQKYLHIDFSTSVFRFQMKTRMNTGLPMKPAII